VVERRRELNENKGKEEDVQERKAVKKQKTSSSESFTIRGSWEGILEGPTRKDGKMGENVAKRSDLGS